MNAALKVCPQCGTEYPANARFCEIDGTALRSAAGSEDLIGSIIADRYCVLKKLGEGGMGQVYLVEHVKMGRKSALKVMHPGMVKDVDAISRFNREAANASRISHPNVASVYDFGETADGIIYLAMEFVDGPPLTSVIEQQGALPAKRAAEIVRQTAEALAVACDMGIVHRDLKPDNIMIARTRDGADLVKVVDFGIAKAAGIDAQKVTKTGLVVGTPDYMSPEQLAGDKLDGRSDIYSLGLVAFNMLTGVLPFPSDSAQESMIMRLTDKPKALAEMRPDVSWPADVQAVMDKALERDASLRYQHATEFGLALFQAVDRMPSTVASEIGTQVMAAPAVPPTRVGPAVATPAAATQASAPVTQAAAPPKKRSMVPVIGGIAAVLVLGAAAFKMMGKPAVAADTTQMKVAAPADAKIDFDQLEEMAKDSVTAAKALERIAGVKTPTDEDKVRVAYVRYLAHLSLGQANACTELKAIRTIAPKTSKAAVVRRNLTETCAD
ncbi:MAG: hypothetical protein JWM41_1030 [Gemmatimonadetes bacterium]|nr:hypothetical protein [Gemmatimonadota bacterium]